MTYFFLDGSQFFTSIYLRQDDNQKTCKVRIVLTMLDVSEIADFNSSAKDVDVDGAVDAT